MEITTRLFTNVRASNQQARTFGVDEEKLSRLRYTLRHRGTRAYRTSAGLGVLPTVSTTTVTVPRGGGRQYYELLLLDRESHLRVFVRGELERGTTTWFNPRSVEIDGIVYALYPAQSELITPIDALHYPSKGPWTLSDDRRLVNVGICRGEQLIAALFRALESGREHNRRMGNDRYDVTLARDFAAGEIKVPTSLLTTSRELGLDPLAAQSTTDSPETFFAQFGKVVVDDRWSIINDRASNLKWHGALVAPFQPHDNRDAVLTALRKLIEAYISQ